jgi:hypothetical protein
MQYKTKGKETSTKNYDSKSSKPIPRRRDKRDRDNYYDERPKGKFKDDEYDEEYEIEYED